MSAVAFCLCLADRSQDDTDITHTFWTLTQSCSGCQMQARAVSPPTPSCKMQARAISPHTPVWGELSPVRQGDP